MIRISRKKKNLSSDKSSGEKYNYNTEGKVDFNGELFFVSK